MDARYLDSFLQVAQQGSTAAAARKLNLTPTAVAQRIKALGHELGRSLLSRAGRNMQLTAAGSALPGPASELLARTRGAPSPLWALLQATCGSAASPPPSPT